MTVAPFVPKQLSEFEADVRLAALHMATSYLSIQDEVGYQPDKALRLAESFRCFLMGLPIASEG
jgi:hypothetical protein